MPASLETLGRALIRALTSHIDESSPFISRLQRDMPNPQVVLPEGAYDVTPKLDIEYDSVAFDTKCDAMSPCTLYPP